MKSKIKSEIFQYSPLEEKINYTSHGLGFILSLVATFFLVKKALPLNNLTTMISVLVFGVSTSVLYAASTCYHYSKCEIKRYKLKVFDHAAIYVLIAGSYTPLTLVALKGSEGIFLCTLVWIIAVVGISLKIFFTGRFKILSTSIYIIMGWMIVFFAKPLIETMSLAGLLWLLGGGVSYTVGAVIYSIKKIKLNHGIFHLFVLAGSVSHFITIYFFVLSK
jgi:hemolysin III